MDINGNSTEDPSIAELKDWLFGRVADDNDIVIDDMQNEFGVYYDKMETINDSVEGTEEYKANMEYLKTSIAELKTKEGRNKIKVMKAKQKITDGIRQCSYGGNVNNERIPEGDGMLFYDNKDAFQGKFHNGVLEREGKLTLSTSCNRKYEGKWQDGLMDGEMRIDTDTGGWIEGYYHHGVAHGFQREFGVRESTMDKYPLMRFVGRYFRGIARGFCWKGLWGGGYICGYVDSKDGSFSGSDIAYIYPDFKTVLRGEFKDEKVIKGQMCSLIGSKMERGICIPTFTKPEGQVFEFEEPGRKTIAKNPLLPEAWEATLSYVKQSNLDQGGEGLFCKQKRPKGSIVAFYNGIRLNSSSVLLEERYGRSDYRIRLNADRDLDIPKGYESSSKYCATLAHKINHTFDPNAEWILFEHPRFGLIRGVKAIRDLQQDEEVLINYQMNLANSPEWYRILWIRHQRHVKKCSDAAIKRILERYTENTLKVVEIPESEELIIPEPEGMQNLDDIPDDSEIEANTPRAEIMKMEIAGTKIESPELPRVEELN